MINKGLFTSKTDLWSTPQWLFDELNEQWRFTIDVCATAENAKCPIYYTPEDDGLSRKWQGVCWMNPPYGREIGKWVAKAHQSRLEGATVVGLLPARTDTAWFHNWVYGVAELSFLRGRLKFNNGVGSAPFPSMIAIWKGEK